MIAAPLLDSLPMPGFRSRRTGPRFPPALTPDDPVGLSRRAVRAALEQGFAAAGVVAGSRAEGWAGFRAFLDAGRHGEMAFLERDAEARREPRVDPPLREGRALRGPRGAAGRGGERRALRPRRGLPRRRPARAEGRRQQVMRDAAPPGAHFRVCVDTAPVLEREWAARAGLGFVGKNGMLIVPGVGSHVVLGELLTDLALAPTAAAVDATWERCGGCSACLDSCPTSAILAPRVVDARRCLSYLTIEKRAPFTPDEESWLEGRLFGCDDCQDVCPWNAGTRWNETVPEPPASLDPAGLASLDDARFEERFARSAVRRATPDGLRRNARAALAWRSG